MIEAINNIIDLLGQFLNGPNESTVDKFINKLNDVFNALGNDIIEISNTLTTDWSNTPFGHWLRLIFNNAIYPIGLSLLSLFFIIGFAKKASMFKMVTLEQIVKVILQLLIAKYIMENSLDILICLFSKTSEYIDKIAQYKCKTTDLINLASQKSKWLNMSYWEFWKMTNRYWPLIWGIKAVKLLAYAICYGRLIEAYTFASISPIPLATLSTDEYSHIGKKFIQNYIVVCIQGLVIIVILKFFPVLIITITSGMAIDIFGVILLNIILICLLFKSSDLANKVFGG